MRQEGHKKYKVLAFARESGGAQAIAPVIKELERKGSSVIVFAKDVAEKVFCDHGFRPLYLEGGESCFIEHALLNNWEGEGPDIVVTSAASLPELDMTEKNLWLWARRNCIRSLAVLDQWQNYARRFSSYLTTDFAFMPDICCVMDEIARLGMIEDGFPAERIVITGQPAFDSLVERTSADTKAELELKRAMGMDNGRPTVVFIGEALRRHLGDEYGYDEYRVLNYLVDIIKDMDERPNLIIKKHPQNIDEDFDLDVISRAATQIVVRIVGVEHPAKRVVLASDVVVGMSSVLLVESILLGQITVSLEIGAIVFNKCFPVHIGAIPLIIEKEKARLILHDLISNPQMRADWMKRQSVLAHLPGAAKRVAQVALDKLRN